MKYFIYARKSSEDKNKQIASIDDQIKEMKKLAEQFGLEIVDIFQESKSAKQPNKRIAFNQMVERIHEGEVQGIICWKLDRLARNPVDAGIIKWMLQSGDIQKIQTHGNEYKTGDNVLLMDMEFGIANQFILDLSKNTKRGLNGKAERGQFPSRAPIGYLNNKYEAKGQKTIVPDPDKFQLVRKLWDHALTGKYSTYRLADIARTELNIKGYTGKPISKNVIYNMLKNPFYYGNFMWGGKEYVGIHEPVITRSEFMVVQEFLCEKVKPNRKRKHYHPYTMTFKCLECNRFLTAEKRKKTLKNKEEKTYVYYHCTNRKSIDCGQGSIELGRLEEQILAKTRTLQLPKEMTEYCLSYLEDEFSMDEKIQRKRVTQEETTILKIEEKLERLFDMRLDGELTSNGYTKRKLKLQDEKAHILNKIADIKSETTENTFKDIRSAFNFNEDYLDAIEKADDEEKRFLVKQVGNSYTAIDRKIDIELKPTYKEVRLLVNSIKSEYGVIETEKALAEQGPFHDLDRIGPLLGDYRESNPNCRYHKPE